MPHDKPYSLTPEQVASITDVELAFSTERLLPTWEEIPEDFKRGNLYTSLAEAIFYGTELPACKVELNDGVKPEHLNRCVRAHLQSFGPKHEHKIAGVGYMISQACRLHPEKT
ncbi:hypothetical protein BTO32_15005 [Marinobacter lutaoensis]|uniref:Uncharacterized protein n=1 Tax=Marinobacter lutaoensis TaxID=135739 RepID=A0A1V2DPR2_9GAMM|nr:hypothetical protein [Marinobacter lutaoensis]ONF42519.1 hypothetical protein BTO32_15005 [Marinobacter lutaoensis]